MHIDISSEEHVPPFMGGMEATGLVRSYELHKGLNPIPIIALTAHATGCLNVCSSCALVNGDQERCLQPGMASCFPSMLIIANANLELPLL